MYWQGFELQSTIVVYNIALCLWWRWASSDDYCSIVYVYYESSSWRACRCDQILPEHIWMGKRLRVENMQCIYECVTCVRGNGEIRFLWSTRNMHTIYYMERQHNTTNTTKGLHLWCLQKHIQSNILLYSVQHTTAHRTDRQNACQMWLTRNEHTESNTSRKKNTHTHNTKQTHHNFENEQRYRIHSGRT